MVKTKQTPWWSDPRAPSKWGTAAKAYITKFELAPHPNVDQSLDYRSKLKLSKYTYLICTVQYSAVSVSGWIIPQPQGCKRSIYNSSFAGQGNGC